MVCSPYSTCRIQSALVRPEQSQHHPPFPKLSTGECLPCNRIVRYPWLDALPEYILGQVGGESADDNFEAICGGMRGSLLVFSWALVRFGLGGGFSGFGGHGVR
jgi:hypothetical protein